jgi:hypothetical protein
VRVLVGLAFKVMSHEHKALGGSGKNKERDERLVKEQLSLFVQKGEGKLKLYTPAEV